jgi:hypothetical protein
MAFSRTRSSSSISTGSISAAAWASTPPRAASSATARPIEPPEGDHRRPVRRPQYSPTADIGAAGRAGRARSDGQSGTITAAGGRRPSGGRADGAFIRAGRTLAHRLGAAQLDI